MAILSIHSKRLVRITWKPRKAICNLSITGSCLFAASTKLYSIILFEVALWKCMHLRRWMYASGVSLRAPQIWTPSCFLLAIWHLHRINNNQRWFTTQKLKINAALGRHDHPNTGLDTFFIMWFHGFYCTLSNAKEVDWNYGIQGRVIKLFIYFDVG